jgi:hypothetical protein
VLTRQHGTGLGAGIHYPTPVHSTGAFQHDVAGAALVMLWMPDGRSERATPADP